VVRGREHVEVVGDGHRTDPLRSVDEHDGPDLARQAPDRRDVGAVPRRGLHRAERDELRPAVDALGDVVGLQPPPRNGTRRTSYPLPAS